MILRRRRRTDGRLVSTRCGKHTYTYREGLELEPAREDGRRCMDSDEILAAGMALDGWGRWAIVAD
jgi:hypothetical protein